MSEHLLWCKSHQDGTAVDCNCVSLQKWVASKITKIATENARLHIELTRLRAELEAIKYAIDSRREIKRSPICGYGITDPVSGHISYGRATWEELLYDLVLFQAEEEAALEKQ